MSGASFMLASQAGRARAVSAMASQEEAWAGSFGARLADPRSYSFALLEATRRSTASSGAARCGHDTCVDVDRKRWAGR